jgi:hypothetical protein
MHRGFTEKREISENSLVLRVFSVVLCVPVLRLVHCQNFGATPDGVDFAFDFAGEGDESAHASQKFDGYVAANGFTHVVEHLSGVHLDDEEGFGALGQLLQPFFGEGPQGDGTMQSGWNALGA